MIDGHDATLQSEARLVLACNGDSGTSELSVFYCAGKGEPWQEVYGASFDSVTNTATVDVFGMGAYVASDTAPTEEPEWPDDAAAPTGPETDGYVDLALSRSDGVYHAGDRHRAFVTIDGLSGEYDVYLAVVTPGGTFHCLDGSLQFSPTNTLEPVVRGWEASRVASTCFADFVLPELAAGDYTWYVILTPTGASPADSANWSWHEKRWWRMGEPEPAAVPEGTGSEDDGWLWPYL